MNKENFGDKKESLLRRSIPYVNDFHPTYYRRGRDSTYVSDFLSRENRFLDIGLNLDCIGGSRANGFFIAPLGIRNIDGKLRGGYAYNTIVSFAHTRIICGYGTNPYNFSNALTALARESGENYRIHAVTFSEEMSKFLRDKIHPAYIEELKRDKVTRVSIEDLYYERGLENYLIRLLDFKRHVRAKINKFGNKVERGRKTKIILLFLSSEQWQEVANSKGLLNTLSYLFDSGYEENISIIPCAENLSDIPEKLLLSANMINGYGARNVAVVKKTVKAKGLEFKVEKAYNKLQTVGVTYDSTKKPYVFPLKGWTKEFFIASEKRKQWENKEKEDYIKYIKKLDNGSRYDSANRIAKNNFKERRKQMFAEADFMEKENRVIPKIKPVIIFE